MANIDLDALRARLAASRTPTVIVSSSSSAINVVKVEDLDIISPPIPPSSQSPASLNTTTLNTLNLQAKIAELSGALLAAHPALPSMLREIHTQLRKDPELVTLLSEEDIGVIVNSLKRQTNTELVTGVVKRASSSSKIEKVKMSQLSISDL